MARTVVRSGQLDTSLATETEVETDISEKKGMPGGIAPLDDSGLVPMANLPTTELATFVEALVMDGGIF
jgi:hypothetical protein